MGASARRQRWRARLSAAAAHAPPTNTCRLPDTPAFTSADARTPHQLPARVRTHVLLLPFKSRAPDLFIQLCNPHCQPLTASHPARAARPRTAPAFCTGPEAPQPEAWPASHHRSLPFPQLVVSPLHACTNSFRWVTSRRRAAQLAGAAAAGTPAQNAVACNHHALTRSTAGDFDWHVVLVFSYGMFTVGKGAGVAQVQ